MNFILAIQIIGCATLTTGQKVEFSKSSYKPQVLDSQSNFLAENNFFGNDYELLTQIQNLGGKFKTD